MPAGPELTPHTGIAVCEPCLAPSLLGSAEQGSPQGRSWQGKAKAPDLPPLPPVGGFCSKYLTLGCSWTVFQRLWLCSDLCSPSIPAIPVPTLICSLSLTLTLVSDSA